MVCSRAIGRGPVGGCCSGAGPLGSSGAPGSRAGSNAGNCNIGTAGSGNSADDGGGGTIRAGSEGSDPDNDNCPVLGVTLCCLNRGTV